MRGTRSLALTFGTIGALAIGACGGGGDDGQLGDDGTSIDAPAVSPDAPTSTPRIKTVFIILLENHSWASIKGSSSAPYINSLLPMGAHAEHYMTPAGNHPSEPNYLWLEGGTNFGITDDSDPGSHHLATHDHFVHQLDAGGIAWKAYAQGISGTNCPLTSSGAYGVKHVPVLFFDDVTDGNSASSVNCKNHVRPYTELAADLASGNVGRYNFITPDMCHDMHGVIGVTCPPGFTDLVKSADDWLKVEVPKILASSAYQDHGALFITWDEGDEPLGQEASDGPIGMILLSPQAKVNYTSNLEYTHSATVRTMQEIFSMSPALGSAAASNDLSDMFQQFP